ncbi:MAG TPA: PQQ-dependent sugar dehydrogenase [Thermoanaerobaculia bacterium]
MILLLVALSAEGALLPGFRVEKVASLPAGKYATSIAVDSNGTLYFTTTDGDLYRGAERVAHLPTFADGNSGLLGMALVDEETAVVHYTNAPITRHVISTVDLTTGQETVLHELVADISMPDRPAPTEHHGGNPTVAPDGSVYFGIGDFGGGVIAMDPKWNAGKIWRIAPDGTLEQFARGLRNPYDMAWDPDTQRLFVTDNGALAGDEVHLITKGDYCGWPFTYGNLAPIEGAVPPDYVWEDTTAPTGVAYLTGANSYLRRGGFLVGGFVSGALYLFPSLQKPIAEPLRLVDRGFGNILDVVESVDGTIFFTNGVAIHRLDFPKRGDCNGDGVVNVQDILALNRELADGDPHRAHEAQSGLNAGSWGCDADADGLIGSADLEALSRKVGRHRAVRRR